MGQEKYRLSFAGETLLQRICRIVHPEVSRILIVAAIDQEILHSERNIRVLRDEIPDAGPLAGISQALTYLRTSEDVPVAALPENLQTCWVPLDAIRNVDPDLESFMNCNTPEDYENAKRTLL